MINHVFYTRGWEEEEEEEGNKIRVHGYGGKGTKNSVCL